MNSSRKQKASSKKMTAIGLMIVIVVMAGMSLLSGFLWWQQANRPVEVGADNTARFVVAKGQGVNAIAEQLREKGLIRSELAFKLKVKQLGISGDIQAGSFELSKGQNLEEVARSLTRGTSDVWVTLLEGWRREEMAQGLKETFADKGRDFDVEAFLEATKDKEGYLFPDTYLMPIEISEVAVANLLTSTFDQKLSEKLKEDAVADGKTLKERLVMASLIEREAKTDATRKMISGILWKRLENDWPLQVDATLQYANGYDEIQNDWWKPPTAAQKEVNSPFNTYKNLGLPPEPISNPSLSSIEAAIYPTDSEYWYYLTSDDGQMRYATTLEEHNQNVRDYLW
jgi:UPF0755 protein